mmetsp:Transcript_28474/g.49163  ORF Transcript_28474/g.49163 Transcript_28474/m.49163 type:complete len:130 (+) Transcript_28474:1211-1600(+)
MCAAVFASAPISRPPTAPTTGVDVAPSVTPGVIPAGAALTQMAPAASAAGAAAAAAAASASVLAGGAAGPGSGWAVDRRVGGGVGSLRSTSARVNLPRRVIMMLLNYYMQQNGYSERDQLYPAANVDAM